jgi:hypothetical protein
VRKKAYGLRDEKQTSTSTAATAAAATTTGVGKVDPDPAAIELLFVETIDSGVGFFRAAQSDETESTRATGVTIGHHDCLRGRRTMVRGLIQSLMNHWRRSSPEEN